MFSVYATSSPDHLHDGARWDFFPRSVFQGGSNTQALGFPFSPVLPHLFLLSPFLSLCFFLRKDKKNNKGLCGLHTMPTAYPLPAWPACCFCKKHCWWGGRRTWVTISIASATRAPCKCWAVFLLEWTGGGRVWVLALVLLQMFCRPKGHARSVQSMQWGRARARHRRAKTRRRAFNKAGTHIRPKEKMSLEQWSKNDNTKHLCSKHCTNIN